MKTMGLAILVTISIGTLIPIIDQFPTVSANRFVNNTLKYNGKNDFLDKLSQYGNLTVTIDRYNISAFVADTDEKRSKGLSGVENMSENQGMLFVFNYPSKQGFWMKEMKFPLDIIWLDLNNSVIHIEKKLQPCTSVLFCTVYSPSKDAKYVLETISGFTDLHSVNVGAKIKINSN
ncbi:MAG: DUF192 domain-containing protein [Thermoproteota archaeon]|jgi:uncharacterized membrane protein (UPF0127 family)|nr:DUF192 domain-containing protein [Thermoproteota archaeon]